ncbi:hypothetical protein [Rubrivirga sp.]|uniref:hypothetical protein n=1 Tax=Rubrivirga sp. TaxID=1885344 RepID=UPI003C726A8B
MSLFTLVGLTLALPAEAQRERPTHAITIDYGERGSGDATITVEQLREGRAPWGRSIREIAVISSDGEWVVIDEFLSSGHTSSVRARSVLPRAESIAYVLVRGARGQPVLWRVSSFEAWPVKWLKLDQEGEEARTSEGGGQQCSRPVGCRYIDPWTCECFGQGAEPIRTDVTRERVRLEM